MNTWIPLLAVTNGVQFSFNQGTQVVLWIGIGIYVAVMLFIGYWASHRVHNVTDFIVAGRRLPMWMATATLLATWFGAGSSMGVAATVYSGDLRDVLADPFGASISLVLAGIFIVGVLRKMRCMTITDVIQRNFGVGAGVYASIWMVPVYIGWLGAQVIGLGVLLNLLTGVNLFYSQLIGAAVILAYTVTGGMWAVTVTDVVQISLIVIGLFIIVPGAVKLAGGFDAVFNPNIDLSLLPKNLAACSFSGWSNYLGNWAIMGLGCMVGQDLLQRSLSSRTDKIAVSSSVVSGVCYMAIAVVPITIGFAAKILLPKWGITEAAMGGAACLKNQVLPRIAIGVLGDTHPILLALFLGALVSAIMSSADSSLLAASSLLVNNVIAPLSPKTSDKTQLILTRIITVITLVVATFIAMKVQSIYSLMKNCWASQLVVVFIPVIAAIYMPKTSRYSVWATMIGGTLVWVGYMYIRGIGMGNSLNEVITSDNFDYELTNGAFYAFIAALIVFFACHWGERITANFGVGNNADNDDEAPNQKNSRHNRRRHNARNNKKVPNNTATTAATQTSPVPSTDE